MKKLFLIGAALLAFACSKNENPDNGGDPQGPGEPAVAEYEIALEPSTVEPWEWRYITLADGVVVTAEDAWDIAVLRYRFAEMAILTPFDEDVRPIQHMVTGAGMPTIGVREDLIWSGIEAVDFSLDKMPPEYTILPANVFLSADGERSYNVEFTGYDPQNGILIMEVQEIEE